MVGVILSSYVSSTASLRIHWPAAPFHDVNMHTRMHTIDHLKLKRRVPRVRTQFLFSSSQLVTVCPVA